MLNGLKSLKRIGFKAFVIIIQLALGLSILNTCIITYSDKKDQLETFNKVLSPEKSYLTTLITYSLNMDNYEMVGEEHQNKIKDKREKMFKKIEEFKNNGIIKSINIYTPFSAFSMIDDYAPVEYQDTRVCSEIIINESFYNDYNLTIHEGRGFVSEDFNKKNYQTIPVILGKGYMDKLKVGDVLDRRWNPSPTGYIQYEVIGFYEDSAIPCIEFTHEGIGSLTYSDYLIIVPITKCVSKYSIENISAEPGLILEVESPAQMEMLKDEFDNITNEDSLYINVRSLKEDYSNVEKVLLNEIFGSLVSGVLLIGLSLVGIITCLVSEITNRKKEYGIRIGCGASKKVLIKEQFFEILFMILFSIIISTLILIIKSLVYLFNINWIIFTLINVVFGVVILIIISIIPMICIRRLNIVELTRGE